MSSTAEAWPVESRWRSLLATYRTLARTQVLSQFQYRAANYFYMVGMVAEPIVYLVVWSTIARQQGGSVDGYTAGNFAAYYITWTLVRNMNIVFTPFGWEDRIRTGELSGWMLRPAHPIHYDLASFMGWKFVVIVLWLPIAAVLTLLFRPELQTSVLQVAVFAVAIWGAYLIRSLVLWVLGMVTFWTTRVAALYETYFVAELLLSGRLVPMDLLPGWAQGLAWAFPFRWTFGFPITALVGPISNGELLVGLVMQAAWTAVAAFVVRIVWRRGVRRYGAVGG
ncbi:MAG: ABC-2 family transporter protein [Acidimicrobiia bacterium]|nr:ABC-2 family transporter protein [Acidimicrobiia bacterium]